jgi:DNA invertase Pin-like site-specific DNA recombinase
MQDARRGHFDVVLVWTSDRIARSVKHFLDVLDMLLANRLYRTLRVCRAKIHDRPVLIAWQNS